MSAILDTLNEAALKARKSNQSIKSLQKSLYRLFEVQGYVPNKIRVTQSFMAEINGTLPQSLPQSGHMNFHHSLGVVKLVWDASVEPLWFTL